MHTDTIYLQGLDRPMWSTRSASVHTVISNSELERCIHREMTISAGKNVIHMSQDYAHMDILFYRSWQLITKHYFSRQAWTNIYTFIKFSKGWRMIPLVENWVKTQRTSCSVPSYSPFPLACTTDVQVPGGSKEVISSRNCAGRTDQYACITDS